MLKYSTFMMATVQRFLFYILVEKVNFSSYLMI